MRRAIVLVPGYGKALQGDAQTRLGKSLLHYTDGFRVRRTSQPGQNAQVITYKTTDRATSSKMEIDVWEAYWGDLIPTREDESPGNRALRGWRLIGYWVFGGALRLLRYGRRQSPGMVWMMALCGFALIIWYVNILLLALTAIATGDMQIDQRICALPLIDGACDFIQTHAQTITTASVTAFIIGFVGLLGWIERFANISDFVMSYLRDDPVGDDQTGLRALTRHRLLAVLDEVADRKDDEAYDEIYVVGHSLGGAIAIDALAEFGAASDRVTLITWGSTLGLLMAKEPKVEAEIAKFYDNETRLRNWVDVAIKGDLMGAEVPRPRIAQADPSGQSGGRHEATQLRARIYPETTWITRPGGLRVWHQLKVHEFYFRAEEAVLMLTRPATQLPPPPS
ncbi:MAG: alpha/beta hydrolase [Pseudomonadota bacterium]